MISTLGWLIICFVLLVIKYAFLQPTNDKYLYRLYEARDNVALAAIEGEISQNVAEYKFVIKNINFALYYIKNNYDFSILLKNIFINPYEVQEYFLNMFGLVEKYDFLEKNYKITQAYFIKSLNVRLFVYMNLVIKPINSILLFSVFLLKTSVKISKITRRFISGAERRINIIGNINTEYSEYRKNYAR